MSVINKMLQELDRRQGMSTSEGSLPPREVRAVEPVRTDREWFWRVVAGLMLVAIGWVGWVAWQLQPRALVTEQAMSAADSARRAPAPVAAAAPQLAASQPAASVPEAQPVEIFKLAPMIDTPIREGQRGTASRAPQPVAPSPASRVAKAAAPQMLQLDVPPARILPAPASGPSRLVKQDRTRTPAEKAEADFRRAVALLSQARVSEAEDALIAALAAEPAHVAARQALVALHLEHRRLDDARRLLQEGLAMHPSNAQFATVLARIFVERRDYAGALEVLGTARSGAQGNAEYHALLGTVLQRLTRHAEAAEAYQVALRAAPESGASWVGLALSLEALGKRPEAAEAYRRGVAAGTLAPEARTYAEQRARQLQ